MKCNKIMLSLSFCIGAMLPVSSFARNNNLDDFTSTLPNKATVPVSVAKEGLNLAQKKRANKKIEEKTEGKREETNNNQASQANLSEILLADLQNKNYLEVANKWDKLYEQLPQQYKNAVYVTRSDIFKMNYGDLSGLSKSFFWGFCGNHAGNELGSIITDEFSATGSKDQAIQTQGYRAGMVYFYVKYQLLKCGE